MHILVTGANGYVGKEFVLYALSQNHKVSVLGRIPHSLAQTITRYEWRLDQPLPDQVPWNEIDCVIHLAHQWHENQTDPEKDPNLIGTTALLACARQNAVKRFVMASTVSARTDSLNEYGRLKARLEGLLEGPHEISARIGLVYGGPLQSMWGTLVKLTALSSFIPMVDPNRPVQPIHIRELAEGLCKLATKNTLQTTRYVLAAHETISFREALKAIAASYHGSILKIFPLPGSVLLALFQALNRLPIIGRMFNPERLLGLMGLPVLSSQTGLTELGITIADMREGIELRPHSSRLRIDEARVLLRYVSSGKLTPKASHYRLYMKGLRINGLMKITPLPRSVRAVPALLRFCEPFKQSPLKSKLELAVAIYESSRQGGEALYLYTPTAKIHIFRKLVVNGMAETVLLPCRKLLSGMLWP